MASVRRGIGLRHPGCTSKKHQSKLGVKGVMQGSWKRKGLNEPCGGKNGREVRRMALQEEELVGSSTGKRVNMWRMTSNSALLSHRVQGDGGRGGH